jgi:uncharacterized repeat protein (TIGR01451 family)
LKAVVETKSHLVHRKLNAQLSVPSQTFYVPLPEEDLFQETFKQINGGRAEAPVTSLISLAISTTGTVIWYDHWEDGYEEDVTSPIRSTTQVWGDNDASNGCAPNVATCTDAADKFDAGDSVVIENVVELDPGRNKMKIRFDGGDCIRASFPIAVTRGAYPKNPGSLMAGAVEVLDTSAWGTSFEAPIGRDTQSDTNAFQYTGLYIMASEDNTKVTIPGSLDPIILNQGQSKHLLVEQGDIVTSDKIVQVDILTGDIGSQYELRWYSLLPIDDWSNEYISPMGDTLGETKVVLYNPSPSSIDVKVMTLDWTETYNIGGKSSVFTRFIETGSGAKFTQENGKNFIALSLTDTNGNGQIFDWGFPVLPTSALTPQVLIGWGFGCTGNSCGVESFNNGETRSVVWVTPVEKADIYVDYNNDGTVDRTYQAVNFLQSQIVHDEGDKDMSGAIIFATKPNTGPEGPSVNIAAAWGQDPTRSGSNDESALDLGTVVVPFTAFQANKIAELVDDNDNSGSISPGDKIRYTILISNVGQVEVPGGGLIVKDTLDADVSYVTNSMMYSVPASGEVVAVSDSPSGTKFPLDGDGISSKFKFARRGGTHEISFLVVINDDNSVDKKRIINTGAVSFAGVNVPFKLETPLEFSAKIEIEKTVYLGHNGRASCNGKEEVTGVMEDEVTYCFEVTNNGKTVLDNVQVADATLSFQTIIGMLVPGESQTVFMETWLDGNVSSFAEAKGLPVFTNGEVIPGLDEVTDIDPAGVKVIVAIGVIGPEQESRLGSDEEELDEAYLCL